jgi:hypothetical protein
MFSRALSRAACRTFAVVVLGVCAAVVAPATASAVEPPAKPWLKLVVRAEPANVPPGKPSALWLYASNLGDEALSASAAHPVFLKVTLPVGWHGVKTQRLKAPIRNTVENEEERGKHCTLSKPVKPEEEPVVATCEIHEPLFPYELFEMEVEAEAPEGAAGKAVVQAQATGGEGVGAPVDTGIVQHSVNVSSEPTPFGVEQYALEPEGEEGQPETQAGSHPFQMTTQLFLNSESRVLPGKKVPSLVNSGGFSKDLHVDLPPGLVGDTQALPRCSDLQFTEKRDGEGEADTCPAETVIGAVQAAVDEVVFAGKITLSTPLYNLVPSKGEPARFGFVADGAYVTLDTVLNGGDYHVVVNVGNVPETLATLNSTVTVWGNPGDRRHDKSRGVTCLARGYQSGGVGTCEEPKERANAAYLDLPTQCEYPLSSGVRALSWTSMTGFLESVESPSPITLTGCENVPFTPSISLEPEKHEASVPTGLKSVVNVPQATTLEEGKIAEADLRNTSVTLPEGVQLSPSAANGLEACSESAIGFEKANKQTGTLEFAPEEAKDESAAEQAAREAAGTLCPKASKVGTVRLRTPLLATELHGSVYLAAQEANPFGSLFALYVDVKDPQTGVNVKLAGKTSINPVTGQITTTFDNAPEAPFEEFELDLLGGPRASVATPALCGNYAATAALAPWSGTPAVTNFPANALNFAINAGAEGTTCQGQQSFAMAVAAGPENAQAGALTGFSLSMGRYGHEQAPTSLTMKLPPGFAGYLKNVEQCPEAEANLGTCGPRSLIGTAKAITGLGEDPYTVNGGRVYITEKYAGAPFGLSVVIPAAAGPFNFGYVVTRSQIFVDPTTAQLTIVSSLPTMVNATVGPHGEVPGPQTGAPVQLRRVDINIPERPVEGKPFQFNPTNCSELKLTSTVTGALGGSHTTEAPFFVKNCQALKFTPELSAEIEQHWTKTEGTGMKIVVKAHEGQANIGKSKVVFPLQVPSRLTTIQKACPEATFNANPATCPEGSVIGNAVAETPVLNSKLQGPAYLVSHGNAAFPDAEFVLQGEGITLILDGQTNIHNGITSSTFNAVPDAPVSTFTVNLPRGPHSAFTGYGELCHATKAVTKTVTVAEKVGKKGHQHTIHVKKSVTENVSEKLVLPTTFTGQNGNVVESNTSLNVTGCQAVQSFKKKAKPKPKKKSKKGKKHGKKKK